MDMYDHVLEDDLKQSAIVATWFIYQTAMCDEEAATEDRKTGSMRGNGSSDAEEAGGRLQF